MSEKVISAEIEPCPNEASQAAQALQRLGFRVLHIGRTISVQAAQRLWEETFSVSFKQQEKRVSAETEHDVAFAGPETEPVPIPLELQHLIMSVAFVEPPEWFGGPS